MSWDYVSGFFDGEGGFMVGFGTSRRVLRLTLSLAQKSRGVLELIRAFLTRMGIFSVLSLMVDGTHTLRVIRARDIVRMIANMHLAVKHRQALAVSDYLTGKLTGNQLLLILKQEHEAGRRKSEIPKWALTKFPLTRLEAKKLGQMNGSIAGRAAQREMMHRRVLEAFQILPHSFTSTHLKNQLGLGIDAALSRGKYLERIGLVSSTRIKRKGRRMYLFTKIDLPDSGSDRTSSRI